MERLQFVGLVILIGLGLIIASPLLIIFALFGILIVGFWFITGNATITVKDTDTHKGE